MAASSSSLSYDWLISGRGWKILLCCTFLTACDPVSFVLVPATVVGASEAEERGFKGVVSDTALRTKINCTWLANEPLFLDRLTMSVLEGRVVLTGVVETPVLKEKAVALTQKVGGVKEVVDEIKVGKPETLGDYSRDSWITTKLKTQLLFDSYIASRNYSIRTVNRIVYLTGIAQNQQELNLVLEHARNISGVKRVIHYVRIKSPPAKGEVPIEPDDDEDPQ